MSWADYDTLITNVLLSNGYAEIPENKLPDVTASNFKHLGYSLKFTGFGGINYLSSDGVDYGHKARLEVGYISKTPEVRDANAELFVTLMKDIAEIDGFHSFTADPTFEDYGDNLHTKGTLEFLIGIEVSC
jgi:hypothetical protein